MKPVLIMLFLIYSFNAVSQEHFEIYGKKTFPKLNRKLEVGRLIPKDYELINSMTGKMFIKSLVNAKDSLPSNVLVRILDLNGKIIKEIDTKYNQSDLDLYFGTSFIGNRKFSIIACRGAFYILNLSANHLIGPIQLSSRIKEGQDAQSGLVWTSEVFNNGQYLIISAIDEGIYCFNLENLDTPVEVEFYTDRKVLFKGQFFFLDHRNDNLCNGIVASKADNYSKEYHTRFLFQGYQLKVDANNQIIKYDIDNRYLVLERNQKKTKNDYLIIDYIEGRLLDDVMDKEKIEELSGQI
jgi:hypothetical protein